MPLLCTQGWVFAPCPQTTAGPTWLHLRAKDPSTLLPLKKARESSRFYCLCCYTLNSRPLFPCLGAASQLAVLCFPNLPPIKDCWGRGSRFFLRPGRTGAMDSRPTPAQPLRVVSFLILLGVFHPTAPPRAAAWAPLAYDCVEDLGCSHFQGGSNISVWPSAA